LIDVSEVYTASIIRALVVAVHTSETLGYFNVTAWHYIPEHSKLHIKHVNLNYVSNTNLLVVSAGNYYY
jgi:hypothetical protein